MLDVASSFMSTSVGQKVMYLLCGSDISAPVLYDIICDQGC